jgi:uncharacterized membrane protein
VNAIRAQLRTGIRASTIILFVGNIAFFRRTGSSGEFSIGIQTAEFATEI